MKNTFFTLLLVLGLTAAASAQRRDAFAENPGTGEVPAAQVDDLTRQMCNQLHLNEAQYIRLRAVNRVKLARIDELQWQYKNDPAQRQALLSELQAQYETECSRILTPSQLSLFRNEQQRDNVTPPVNPNEGGLG